MGVRRLFVRHSLFSVAVLLVSGARAFGFAPVFGVDPSVDFAALAKKSAPTIRIQNEGYVYDLDASAVLPIDGEKLFHASACYDDYVKMGIPHVKASQVVELGAPGSQTIYIYTVISSLRTSKHYMAVHFSNLPDGFGIYWELSPKKSRWAFEEDSQFEVFEGSWFIKPISSNQVYIRYVLHSVPATGLPAFFVELFAKRELRKGVEGLIQTLTAAVKTGAGSCPLNIP